MIQSEIGDIAKWADGTLLYLEYNDEDAHVTMRSIKGVYALLKALPLWAAARVRYRILSGGIYSPYGRPHELTKILGVSFEQLRAAIEERAATASAPKPIGGIPEVDRIVSRLMNCPAGP